MAKRILGALVLFISSMASAQGEEGVVKTDSTLEKGDCFVLAGEDFAYGLVFVKYHEVDEAYAATIGSKLYSFIPIELNQEEEGMDQFFQGTINIRCIENNYPECGYYTFQASNFKREVDALLGDLEYVGILNYPSSFHTEMGGGGSISDKESFKELFESFWNDAVLDDPEWKQYTFFDVITMRKGLTFSSYSRD